MTLRTIFDHLPKTGGTSIIAALGSATGDSGLLPETIYPHHVALGLAKHRRFLGAHLWFFPGEALAANWFYATLLREPIERFLSQYYFHRGHQEQVRRREISDATVRAAVELGIDTYLATDCPSLRNSFSNFQARHFAARVCDAAPELDETALFDAAVSSLEQYDLVGVFSNLQEFSDRYCNAIAAPRQHLRRLNVTPNRPGAAHLPPALVRQLHECNGVDRALYAWAQQRFTKRPSRISTFFAASWRRLAPPHARNVTSHLPARAKASRLEADFGDRRIEIVAVACNGHQHGAPLVAAGEAVVVTLSCIAAIAVTDVTAGIAIRDDKGALVLGTNSRLLNVPLAVSAPGKFVLTLTLHTALASGVYRVTLALHKGFSHTDGCYHWMDNAATFSIAGDSVEARVDVAAADVDIEFALTEHC